jgi:hypothetical protein
MFAERETQYEDGGRIIWLRIGLIFGCHKCREISLSPPRILQLLIIIIIVVSVIIIVFVLITSWHL